MTSRRIPDRTIAALIGVATLLLYIRTLLPHLGGTEDTAKFQYLGAVLGTAHSPGYPTYVLIAHLFSRLPFATLAYRVNLMSACFGAAAAALCYLSARRLECSRPASAVAALALAAGRAFWGNAVIAEVYTLNVALWTGAVLFLLSWRQSGRDRDLYAGTACVAIGLGNHLTILGLFPAAFALLVLSGRRWFRPRIVVTCAAILAAGVAQYGFIWLRTLQGARYLESSASSVQELVAVVTARRFADQMFSFGLRALVVDRVPFIWSQVRLEMGIVGFVVAVAGLVWLMWKKPADAALLLVGATAVAGLTANVEADAGGFLLPVFVMLWVAAAAGYDAACALVSRTVGTRTGVAVLGVAALLPIAQVRSNYAVNDHHRQQFENQYFEALFRELPERSVLMINDYTTEQMFTYSIVSGDFPRAARPLRLAPANQGEVARLVADGVSVFAFPYATGPLRGHGLAFTPVRLNGPLLRSYLADVPSGAIVAAASSGVELPTWFPDALNGQWVRGVGPVPVSALLGIKGRPTRAAPEIGGETVEVSALAGSGVGGTGVRLQSDVRIAASPHMASVTFGGDIVARVKQGVAVAVVDSSGSVDRQTFDSEHGFRAELSSDRWPLVRVMPTAACRALGDNLWHDLTDTASETSIDIRLDNYRPFDASLVLYVASALSLEPRLGNFYAGCQVANPCPPIEPPRLASESYDTDSPDDVARLRARLGADGVAAAGGLLLSPRVARVEVSANDQGQYVAFELGLGAVPSAVVARARTDSPEPQRAAACALVGPRILLDSDEPVRAVEMAGDPVVAFGPGWHRPEPGGGFMFRWTSARSASLLVPLSRSEPIDVVVEASGLNLTPPATLHLAVNGKATEPRPLVPGWHEQRWLVPAQAWREGMNEVVLWVSRAERPSALVGADDGRVLGAAVKGVRFERAESPARR